MNNVVQKTEIVESFGQGLFCGTARVLDVKPSALHRVRQNMKTETRTLVHVTLLLFLAVHTTGEDLPISSIDDNIPPEAPIDGNMTPVGAPSEENMTPAGAPSDENMTPAEAPSDENMTPAVAPSDENMTPAEAPSAENMTPDGAPNDGNIPVEAPTGDDSADAIPPAEGDSSDAKGCVFPFIYHGNEYYGCTLEESTQLWCATTVNYDKDKNWELCNPELGETYSGDRSPCVFPFVYRGRKYYGCTTENSPQSWCATTSNYDEDKAKWGYCNPNLARTYSGNAGGATCVFPFFVGGTEFTRCTSANATAPWCATTSDYDQDRKWGFCSPDIGRTLGGNSKGATCVFPFVYGNHTYTGCTSVDSSAPWCATTSNYDQDLRWGFCSAKTRRTYGGNSAGEDCVNPFIYKGKEIYGCSMAESETPWCATTANYDQDRKWAYCNFNIASESSAEI